MVAVCDGMSSQSASLYASRKAMEFFSSEMARKLLRRRSTREAMKKSLQKVFNIAQLRIEEEAVLRGIRVRIGTTGVLAKYWRPLLEKNPLVTVAHIGDSRCYRRRGDRFECKTIDAVEMIDELRTLQDAVNQLMHWQNSLDGLDSPEALNHFLKSIGLREIQLKEVEQFGERLTAMMSNFPMDRCPPTVMHWKVEKGDEYYVMSDGINKNIPPDRLHEIAISERSIAEKTDQMIEEAQNNGITGKGFYSSPDDTTVAVMKPIF